MINPITEERKNNRLKNNRLFKSSPEESKVYTGTFVSMVISSLIQGDINIDVMGLSGVQKMHLFFKTH